MVMKEDLRAQEAGLVRDLILVNEGIIQIFLDQGTVTNEQIDEAINDDGLRTLYQRYLEIYETEGKWPEVEEEFKDYPERIFAWWRWLGEECERRSGLRLISPEKMAQAPEQPEKGRFGR